MIGLDDAVQRHLLWEWSRRCRYRDGTVVMQTQLRVPSPKRPIWLSRMPTLEGVVVLATLWRDAEDPLLTTQMNLYKVVVRDMIAFHCHKYRCRDGVVYYELTPPGSCFVPPALAVIQDPVQTVS